MGFSLNPLSDVASLGNSIGGLFGNNTAPTSVPSIVGNSAPTLGLLGSSLNQPATNPNFKFTSTTQTQPNANSVGTGLGTDTVGSGTGTDSSAYTPVINQTNDAIARAIAAYGNLDTNAQNTYNQNNTGLQSAATDALNAYNSGNIQNQQQYQTGQNQVNQQASQDKQSLLRLLAGMGAGGGSEAQYLVPQLVGQEATTGLGLAANNYGQNAKAVSTTYNQFQNDEKQQQEQLNDWLSGQKANDAAGLSTTKSNLLNILQGLQNQTDTPANYSSELNSISSAIPNAAVSTPTFTGVTPKYVAPSLSTFTPAGAQAAQATIQQNAQGTGPSLLSLLAGQQKDKNGILG